MLSQSSYTKVPWVSAGNTLLVRDDVGHGKPSTYDLPPHQFVYGRPLDRDPEGAKEVTMIWKFHDETRDPTMSSDFKRLNKMSVRSGMHTSKGYSEFRRSHEAPLSSYKGKNQFDIRLPDKDFTYGRPNRPSTPIKHVIGNLYGLESEAYLSEIYSMRTSQFNQKQKYRPKSNKSTYLNKITVETKLQQMKQKDSKNLFKLRKFQIVAPRTNSHSRGGPFQKSQIQEAQKHEETVKLPQSEAIKVQEENS